MTKRIEKNSEVLMHFTIKLKDGSVAEATEKTRSEEHTSELQSQR